MSERVRDLLQVLATGGLLAGAVYFVGGEALLARVRAADPAWLAIGVVLTVPMQILSAARWAVVARVVGAPIGFRTALGEYYVALLVNSIAPGGVAGDALRVWRHGHAAPAAAPGQRFTEALHAVVIERAAGQVVLAVLLAGGLASRESITQTDGGGLAGAAFVGVGLVLALAVLAVLAVGAVRGSATGGLVALWKDLRRLAAAPVELAVVFALSAGAVACYVAIFLATTRSIGPLPDTMVGLALLGIPLALAAMTLPVSVGGLGPREATAVAVWPAFGLAAADGAAAALLYGAAILIGSLPGVFLLRQRGRGPVRPRP